MRRQDLRRGRSSADLHLRGRHCRRLGGDRPAFGFSDTWQLVINTGTTIVTFLMVFLIQNSQNRDAAAMQAKLDELLRAVAKARGEFIGIEHLTDNEIEKIRTALEEEASSPPTGNKVKHDSLEELLKRR